MVIVVAVVVVFVVVVVAVAAAAAAGVVVVVVVAMSGKNHVHKPLRKGKQGYVFFSFFSSFVVFLSRFF